MNKIKENQYFANHELVSFIEDEKTGLEAIVSIHNTRLGPATGGTRMQRYASTRDALADALQLSRAMSYKAALARVPFGGGKAVIIDRGMRDRTALLRAYGERINLFGGMFTTGTDVGISDTDTATMAESSSHILGQNKESSITTSYAAALGVFSAMESAVRMVLEKETLSGVRVVVKGVGKLGGSLVDMLVEAGAIVYVADVNQGAVNEVLQKHPSVTVVQTEDIHMVAVDVFSPCALGGDVSSKTVSELNCRLICGGANNQLANAQLGKLLLDRGIHYVPDYIANAGGLIHIVDELQDGGYNEKRVRKQIKQIAETVQTVLSRSEEERKPPNVIADVMAEQELYDPV